MDMFNAGTRPTQDLYVHVATSVKSPADGLAYVLDAWENDVWENEFKNMFTTVLQDGPLLNKLGCYDGSTMGQYELP